MTLPTRPIEDVVADLRALTYVQRSRRENVAVLNEAADLLLSQAREVEDVWKKDAEIAGLNVNVEWLTEENKALQHNLELGKRLVASCNSHNTTLQQRLEAVEDVLASIADCREVVPFGENPLDYCIDRARQALSAIQPVGGE